MILTGLASDLHNPVLCSLSTDHDLVYSCAFDDII